MPLLDVSLLGQFRLSYDGLPIPLNQSRLQTLLAHLLLKRHAPQSRQYLAFLLWPDSNDSQAQSNLRTLLNRLRRSFPQLDGFLAINAKTMQWRVDAPFILDVAQFDEAIAHADQAEMAGDRVALRTTLEKAVAIYTGELLPGHYDEWLLPERERFSQRYIKTLERLIGLLESQRAYGAAIEQSQRLLRYDPLHEEGYETLMRLQAVGGDRAGALRTYQICATTLERELGVAPGAALQDAYQHLLQMDKVPVVSSPVLPAQLSLVGRQREWHQVQGAWQATVDGQAQQLVISGEAGIGKTRLAEELLGWAERQGIVVACARAYAAEGTLAYAPVTDWLRTERLRTALSQVEDIWLCEVTRLLPELLAERPHLPPPGRLAETWQQQRFFEALARAVFAVDRPLLLLLDDLQWCDGETLKWLHYLLRFPNKGRLLVVGTVRSEELDASHPLTGWLINLRQEDRLAEIGLGPLDQKETTALAAQVAEQGLLPSLAERLYGETEGNPLFVVETMRAVGKQVMDLRHWRVGIVPQLPVSELHSSVSTDQPLPPRIQAVIESRLNRLSPTARDLACLAATVGRAFTIDILLYLHGGEEETLVNGLDELWQRRIIREQGVGTYDFSHDKLREVAYASINRLRQQLLHRRVAQALADIHSEELNAVSGQIAAHFERAGLREQAIEYYQRAAEAAERLFANAEAITLLQRALNLFQETVQEPAAGTPLAYEHGKSEQAARLYERLGDLLGFVGQLDNAQEAFKAGLSQTFRQNVVQCARLYRKQANVQRTQHNYREAKHFYQEATATLGAESPTSPLEWWQEWIQIQLEQMWVRYWLDQWQEAAVEVEKIQQIVETYGTPSQHINFLNSLAGIRIRREQLQPSSETVTYLERALAICTRSGTLTEIAWTRFMLGFTFLWQGDLERCEEQLPLSLTLSEQTGDVSLQSRCLTYLTILYRKRNALDTVRQLLPRALEAATAAQMPEYIGAVHASMAWLAWREGDLAAVEDRGQAALIMWQQLPQEHASSSISWTAFWPLTGLAVQKGQTAQAFDYLRQLVGPARAPLPHKLGALIEKAQHSWQQGDKKTAHENLQEILVLAREYACL